MTKWAFFVNIKLNHTSKEYRVLFDLNLKTKAEVITAADQKKGKLLESQLELKVKLTRENACDQFVIGFWFLHLIGWGSHASFLNQS